MPQPFHPIGHLGPGALGSTLSVLTPGGRAYLSFPKAGRSSTLAPPLFSLVPLWVAGGGASSTPGTEAGRWAVRRQGPRQRGGGARRGAGGKRAP